MVKIVFIINPEAGKGKEYKTYQKIKPFISSNSIPSTVFQTNAPRHAIEIAKKSSEKFDRIIIVSGDGTLNEVINGLDLGKNILCGLLPVGSGNDFARSLTLSKDIYKLLNVYYSENPPFIRSNIGNVEVQSDNNKNILSTRFINSLGIGFDAHVAYLNQNSKVLSGTASYIVAIIKALVDFKSVKFSGTIDEQNISSESLFIAVGNGKTIGGGLYLTPDALLDDNLLDLSTVDKISRITLLRLLPLALINRLASRPELNMYKFKQATINLDTPYFVHTDGEIISSTANKVMVSIREEKINFMTG